MRLKSPRTRLRAYNSVMLSTTLSSFLGANRDYAPARLSGHSNLISPLRVFTHILSQAATSRASHPPQGFESSVYVSAVSMFENNNEYGFVPGKPPIGTREKSEFPASRSCDRRHLENAARSPLRPQWPALIPTACSILRLHRDTCFRFARDIAPHSTAVLPPEPP